MQTLVRRFKFSLHKAKESQVELSLGELLLALTYAISVERDVRIQKKSTYYLKPAWHLI